jgi:hypothetical protein
MSGMLMKQLLRGHGFLILSLSNASVGGNVYIYICIRRWTGRIDRWRDRWTERERKRNREIDK